MTRRARRFAADTQALRRPHLGRDSAWIAEEVRVPDAANRIAPGVDDVQAAIEAAVFLSTGDGSGGGVKGDRCIEEVRRSLRREVRAAVTEDILQTKNDRSRPTGWQM